MRPSRVSTTTYVEQQFLRGDATHDFVPAPFAMDVPAGVTRKPLPVHGNPPAIDHDATAYGRPSRVIDCGDDGSDEHRYRASEVAAEERGAAEVTDGPTSLWLFVWLGNALWFSVGVAMAIEFGWIKY